VKAVEITKPHTAIPIHYNDFSVFRSGLDDFKKAAEASATSTEFAPADTAPVVSEMGPKVPGFGLRQSGFRCRLR
jgi:hypothetical protein